MLNRRCAWHVPHAFDHLRDEHGRARHAGFALRRHETGGICAAVVSKDAVEV